MSLVKKSDVKNHLSAQFRKAIHLSYPDSQPDATGFSGAGSISIPASPSTFAEDLNEEHSATGKSIGQADRVIDSASTRPQAVTKSATS